MEKRLLNLFSCLCVLVVVAPSGALAGYLTDGLAMVSRAMSSVEDVYSPWSLGQVERWFEANVFHTAIDSIVPSIPFLRSSPSLDFSQIRRCARADVHKCLYYGNSSNGLPPQLHGVLWQDGVNFDEVGPTGNIRRHTVTKHDCSDEFASIGLLIDSNIVVGGAGFTETSVAISPVGDWDPVKKTLFIDGSGTRNWAGRGTGSVKDSSGLFFLPAGSAHLNALASIKAGVVIQFNENVTFGQIYAVSPLLIIPRITVPKNIIDWTMELLPDGTWLRKSRTLGLPEPGGDYILKPIVTGDGEPGPFYDEWVKDRGGEDFLYLEKIFP